MIQHDISKVSDNNSLLSDQCVHIAMHIILFQSICRSIFVFLNNINTENYLWWVELQSIITNLWYLLTKYNIFIIIKIPITTYLKISDFLFMANFIKCFAFLFQIYLCTSPICISVECPVSHSVAVTHLRTINNKKN